MKKSCPSFARPTFGSCQNALRVDYRRRDLFSDTVPERPLPPPLPARVADIGFGSFIRARTFNFNSIRLTLFWRYEILNELLNINDSSSSVFATNDLRCSSRCSSRSDRLRISRVSCRISSRMSCIFFNQKKLVQRFPLCLLL